MYQSLEIETANTNNGEERANKEHGAKMIKIAGLALMVFCVIGAVVHVKSHDTNVTGSSVGEKKHAIVLDENQQVEQEKPVDVVEDQRIRIRTLTCGQSVNGRIRVGQRRFYRLRTPASGTVTISTCNSNQLANRLTDSIVYVFAGRATRGIPVVQCDDCDPNAGACIPMNNERYTLITGRPPRRQNTAPLRLRVNTLYTVGVGGWSTSAGRFRLQVTCGGAATSRPTSTPTTTTLRPTFAPVARGQCPQLRVRRDWFSLTQAERNIYLDGYLELRRNGKLAIFEQEHVEATVRGRDRRVFHGVNAFLPWHRYFIWELEEQIRALGGRFSCFVLPYWDWSRAGDNNWRVSQIPMFNNQGLGGNGRNGGCVRDGKLSQQSGYRTTGGTCLMRSFEPNNPNFGTSATLLGWVADRQMSFVQFSDPVEGEHGNAHVNVGGTLGNAGTATDDPVFFLLHGFVDMLWAMRQDCQNRHSDYPNLNSVLSYPLLRQQRWAKVFGRTYTVRDVVRTHAWNFTYHASDMKRRSGLAMPRCTWNEIQGIPTAADGYATSPIHGHSSDGSETEAELGDAREIERKCVLNQEDEIRKGLSSRICKYAGPLQACPGTGYLDITLAELLSKPGVKGVKCLEDYRRKNYAFAKQLGYLRALCNGASDPVCWRE